MYASSANFEQAYRQDLDFQCRKTSHYRLSANVKGNLAQDTTCNSLRGCDINNSVKKEKQVLENTRDAESGNQKDHGPMK